MKTNLYTTFFLTNGILMKCMTIFLLYHQNKQEPYFGKVGTVTDLPFKPIILDTETKARVAEIKLHDGKKYLVPRSNLEVILDY